MLDIYLDWIKEHVYIIPIAVIAIIIGVCIILACSHHIENAELTSKEWTRSISIEKYDWVHHSKIGTFAPADARNVHRWTDSHTRYESYTDSKGKTKQRTVHYYENHISYEVQEWAYSRDVRSSGQDNDSPVWPEFQLGSNPAEREGHRSEQYTVKFKVKDKEKKYHPEYAEFINLEMNDTMKCNMNGFGVIVDIINN